MNWKVLDEEETEEIYNKYMKQDFPPQEIKPLKTIVTLMERRIYRTIGYYDDGQLVGYSFLCHHRDGHAALLDYLAVNKKLRGNGYGQKILNILREIYRDYDTIILEVENPDFARNDEQLEERTRRIRFYEKCGTIYEGQTGRIFEVDYCIMQLPCAGKAAREELRQLLIEIYQDLVREPHFTRKVLID